jgi:hypothetical protein
MPRVHYSKAKLAFCVSTVSIVCATIVKISLIASRPITAGCTDDADGTDAIFGALAHPDHSYPRAAFAGKRDLDPNGPQKSLRPAQPAGKRPRVFGPCTAGKKAST